MAESSSPWVVDVGDEDFEREVVERSRTVPVVVDFWAEWCGPCRTLGPLLERLAEEHGGAFVLAKVDVERAQGLATKFQISGIPAVRAFVGGEPGPSFTGLLPEAQLREFLRELVPSEADGLVAAAREASDDVRAAELLRQALALDPSHAGAGAGLARVLVAAGELEEAARMIDGILPGGDEAETIEELRAVIDLKTGAPQESIDELEGRVSDAPGDATSLCLLGRALAALGRFPESLSRLLEAAELDKALARSDVKDVMVRVFRAVGNRSELADDFRSKLARLLY